MSTLRISITEDEALIADHLAACLEDLGYEIVAIADNAAETIGNLTIHKPDIALIDIQLRGEMDGIQLAQIIRDKFNIPFVYITSNSDSATIERLKETQPSGFILKPFTTHSLGPIIEIAMHNFRLKTDENAELVQIEDALFVRDKHNLVKLKYAEILYAEAQSNYTLLKTASDKFLLSQTLKVVEEKLLHYGFIRVHRSYLVNMSKITQIGQKSVVLDSIEIPLSDTNRADLMQKIKLI